LVETIPIKSEADPAGMLLQKVKDKWIVRALGTSFDGSGLKVPESLRKAIYNRGWGMP